MFNDCRKCLLFRWRFANSFGNFVTVIKANEFVHSQASPMLVRVRGVSGGGSRPTVTMCSCISNFLWRREKWEGRKKEGVKGKEVRKTDGEKGGPCRTHGAPAVSGLLACARVQGLLDNINFRQYSLSRHHLSCQVCRTLFVNRNHIVVSSGTQTTAYYY